MIKFLFWGILGYKDDKIGPEFYWEVECMFLYFA